MTQKYTSADTSINTVNKVYTKMNFTRGSTVLDYGGGKYDSNIEYMAEKGVNVKVFDPFNRSPAHNESVMRYFKTHTPDYIVNSNVLNVISELAIVNDIINNIHKLAGPQTICYFAIYEGNKTGIGKVTSKGFQRNEPTAYYVPLIQKKFKTVIRKGNIIIALKN